MSISLTVPDLATDDAAFDIYFRSFSVSKQSDGQGGVVYQGTLTVEILDSVGQPYKTASLTKDLGTTAKSALRDFIKTQYLTALKTQENL